MAKKTKIRFYARIDGIERELLSVQQRDDGSLVLNSGVPKFWENADGTLSPFHEQHYSVHKVKEGSEIAITQKTLLADGEHHSNISYIHNTAEYLLWPIHGRRVPLFQDETRRLKARQKDTVIEVARFHSTHASLVYTVFVTRVDFDTSFLQPSRIAFKTAKFDEFQVILLPAFLNVPTLDIGDVVGISTSPPVVNNVRDPNHFQIRRDSFLAKEMLTWHWFLMEELRQKLHSRVASMLGATSDSMKMHMELTEQFTSLPLMSPLDQPAS